jgi:hypothetical protein
MSKLSRRALVASASSLPALAIPTASLAASADPHDRGATCEDPIFAAIAAHQRAWAEFSEKCSDLDQVGANDEVDRLSDAIDAAADELLDILPTTVAGVCALLAYAADHACGGNSWPDGYVDENPKTAWDRENGVSWEVFLHRSLATALPTIASRSATRLSAPIERIHSKFKETKSCPNRK